MNVMAAGWRFPVGGCLLAAALTLSGGDGQSAARGAPAQPASAVAVTTTGGRVAFRTAAAEFDVLPSGYVQAYLIQDGKRLTLDDPDAGETPAGDELTVGGQPVNGFVFDAAGHASPAVFPSARRTL